MKRIGLMDCNNFFVSCERLFRPDLVRKPVAVLSSNDGCIVARSQEVKDIGITMGVPYFHVKDLCKKHDVTLFSSNFPLYRDISTRVMTVLKEIFPQSEVYSVDEAFFEIEDSVTEDELVTIRKEIIRRTGIPISIGIGPTKTIAKVASSYAKKGSGVFYMDKDTWNQSSEDISCGSVWGIGRQMSKKLSQAGILNVKELLSRDRSFFKNTFGVVGERLLLELTGVPAYQVGDSRGEENKSLMSTRSFKSITHERNVLESALGHHVAHIGEKLREQGVVASRLWIMVAPSRYGDFAYRKHTAGVNLDIPTQDTRVLLKETIKLLETLYDPETPYKKAGVGVSGIVPHEFTPTSLFDREDAHMEDLYAVADILNDRFGSGTVRPGVVLMTDKWKSSKARCSQEYTTKWSEIARVKAL